MTLQHKTTKELKKLSIKFRVDSKRGDSQLYNDLLPYQNWITLAQLKKRSMSSSI